MAHSFYGHIYGTLPRGIDLNALALPGRRRVFYGCGCSERYVDGAIGAYCTRCYDSLEDHAQHVRHELPLTTHCLTVWYLDKDPHYRFTADDVERLQYVAMQWPNTFVVSGTSQVGFTMSDTVDHRALRKEHPSEYEKIVRQGLVHLILYCLEHRSDHCCEFTLQ